MSLTNELQQACRSLLEEKRVDVIIGYGRNREDAPAHPIFVTTADECNDLVWDNTCYANLATYLNRKEVQSLGRPGIIVKGCDARSVVVLESESQINREEMVVIGVACEGVGDPRQPKCDACDAHMPADTDMVIGEVENPPITDEQRYAVLAKFMEKTPDERMAYWQEELSRCLKCYACRQACPLCYCTTCIVDKNRPQRLETSATPKANLAWHITRAFHLAGRCIGCGACTQACSGGVDLMLLNASLSKAAEENFGYRAGTERDADPLIGSFSEEDKEGFIR